MLNLINKNLKLVTMIIFAIQFILMGQARADVAPGWIPISPIIAKASIDSGVDVKLLAAMGAIESSFIPAAKNSSSSARGVYQFTKRTWRVTLKSYGSAYGLTKYADVHDPYANAVMAAEYIKENVRVLERGLQRKPTYYEIYMAHLLSPLRAVDVAEAPSTELLANRWPAIAKGNPTLFFNKDGSPRTTLQFIHVVNEKVNKALHAYGKLANVALVKYKDGQVLLAKLSDMLGNFDTCDVPVTNIMAVHFISYNDDSELETCPFNPGDRNIIGILNRDYEEDIQ